MKKGLGSLILLLLVGILLFTAITGCGSSKEPEEIRIGGKNFSEQLIMAEMLSILI
mgnify:FL=1